MRVHHLNCATLCPRPAKLVHGQGGLGPGRFVCHCLLLETAAGLVLVDAGLSTATVARPSSMNLLLRTLLRPTFDAAESALAQVTALGFDPRDVRHVLITHADTEHVDGIADFPWADIHLLDAEYEGLTCRPSPLERIRYPRGAYLKRARFVSHALSERNFEGFAAVAPIAAEPDLLLVSLPGHSRGHAGVAMRTDDGWLLHAGDAYFHRSQMDPVQTYIPPGLSLLQLLDDFDTRTRLTTQEQLRLLRSRRGTQIKMFCSHDPMEFDVCMTTQLGVRKSQLHIEDGGRARWA